LASTTIGPWDYVGIIGTGQSLSVGTPPALTTEQPYDNLKLSLGPKGNAAVPPWDPALRELSLVPLVEPLRAVAVDYPSPYPANTWGETLHTAMANQVSALVRAASAGDNYLSVHTVVGESGQGIAELSKHGGDTTGITGRAYAATLFEVAAIARLAREAGRSYGVSAIVLTHGETDSGNPTYRAELDQLQADYQRDLAALTGQTRKIPIYVSQQHAYPNGAASQGARPLINQLQWQLGRERPDEFVCTGPKYQFAASKENDGVHLSALGYQMLGEKLGQVYYAREVLKQDWRPLAPLSVSRTGQVVTVAFHVPVPPLVWDESFDDPTIRAWSKGKGFELRAGDVQIPIASVHIRNASIEIAAVEPLPEGELVVGYALTSQGEQLSTASKAVRWGKLRDSDPFVGASSRRSNPNYCVSFELPVP
jgi:lysophospholipase L1-like esterase